MTKQLWRRHTCTSCAAIALVAIAAGRAAGQESLGSARELYASAAYEDALTVLNRLQPAAASSDETRAIAQYRAFCLLALGRTTEAERAIEGVVIAQPSYHPSDQDASPRLRAAFSDVRRRLLPGIVQERYGGAKAAFDRKDFEAAADAFKTVVDLLSDPDISVAAKQAPLSDLRTLAVGFRELSTSASAPPAPEPVPAPPPLAVLAPRPAVSASPRIFDIDDAEVVPPVVVRQALPAIAGNAFPAGHATVAVVIGETGDVESVMMVESFSPIFDRQIVEAARRWRYRPAMLDGRPVKFRRVVQVNFTPGR